MYPTRCVLQYNSVRATATQNEARGRVSRVTESALSLDDDHIGVLALEGFHNQAFQFTRTKLRGDGVHCDAVAGALDQSGLPCANHDSVQAAPAEGPRQDRGRRPFPDRAVGAEHGDAWARDMLDASVERSHFPHVAGLTHILDVHVVLGAGRYEFRVVVQKLVQAVHDVHAHAYRGKHHAAFVRRQHTA